MPMYTIVVQEGALDGPTKEALAGSITALHVELTGTPREWAHVVFLEYAPGSGFNAGAPGPMFAVTATIRSGHDAQSKRRLLTSLWTLVRATTGAPDERIAIGLQEVGPGQAMEMGRVLPEVAADVT